MTDACQILDLENLPAGALVLTPNRRLAAWLVRDHDDLMKSRGLVSWPRLNAKPLDIWLQEYFEQICLLIEPGAQGHPRLLSNHQSALLWRQVLERLWQGSQDLDGLAQLAQQARTLGMRWCWQAGQWQNTEKFEHQQFESWHLAYQQRLKQENAIDSASLPQWVMANGSVLRAGLPQSIFLHGFNDPDEPQLQQLQNWLRQEREVNLSALPARQNVSQVVQFQQWESQFPQAIHWALQQRQPGRRVAIVIPNLQSQRAHIRSLCQHFWSLQSDAQNHPWSDIINITAGQTLTEYPLVAQLVMWMRGLNGALTLQEWSILLTSPYFCPSMNSWLERDAFVQTVRERNHKSLRLSALVRIWESNEQSEATLNWLRQIQSFAVNGKQRISRWLNWFTRFLPVLFSQQERSFSSEEYQVHQRLQESVALLQDLDEWLGEVDFSSFRQELERLLANVQFQPQTETAPIQIMGLLEAAGLTLDAMWICECEAVNWPQALNPSPLLSRRLQRGLNMPGASPERELQYASRLLRGFIDSTSTLILSWGQWQGDTEHTCSALLESIPMMTETQFCPTQLQSAAALQYHSKQSLIGTFEADAHGSVLAQEHAKGGSALIRAQSLCPFKAFAEFRLKLRQQEELVEGVKATDRGSFLHKVMESIWRELGDLANLQALLADKQRFNQWLTALVEQELSEFRKSVLLEPEGLYLLEKQRALNIARQWLQYCESPREFFEVAYIEQQQYLTIGGLQLSLKVDRIDRLQDGSLAIIDYKTSNKDYKSWLGERPEEPQLPLYTLLEPDATKSILFGVLRSQDLAFKGLVASQQPIQQEKSKFLKVADDWASQMQEWHTVLQQLASDYREGKAIVDPLKEEICTHCHLSPVCRVKEVALDGD